MTNTSSSKNPSGDKLNPGELLREQRIAKGLSVESVAAQMNIPLRTMQLIEDGAFERMAGHTFARGYVRSYAKLLQMDQEEMVKLFDRFTGTDAKGSEVRNLDRIREPVRFSQIFFWIVSFILLLLLGLACFLWWQGHSQNKTAQSQDVAIQHIEVDAADGTTEVHPLVEGQAASAALTDQASVPGNMPIVATTSDSSALLSQPLPDSSTAVTAPVQAVQQADAQEQATTGQGRTVDVVMPSASKEGTGLLEITYVDDCWTKVTDADGQILVSALKRKGETMTVRGKPPLQLHMGRAEGAKVTYDGKFIATGTASITGNVRMKLGQ